MTNSNLTAIALLVDRSGSMQAIRTDAEGAIAAFLDTQKAVPGDCTVRLSQFDDTYHVVYRSTPIADAPPYKLHPHGRTALLDAIGRLVTDFGEELRDLAEADRPGKVIIVVQTDGAENASTEWTIDAVNALITHQREAFAWDFVFLGANQDAIKTGAQMGFAAGSSMSFAATSGGTQSVGVAASNYATRSRTTGSASFTEAEREAAAGETSS